MLTVNNLTKRYADVVANSGVTFTAEDGQVTLMVGPNGAGKSTTLNTISGLLRSKTGSIEFMGQSLAKVPSHKIVERGLAWFPKAGGSSCR